jgi:preprotein translocase subunit SecG
MSFVFWLLFVLLVIVCLFLILLVLIQKGRGGGLSNAFGGGGGNTAFGSKTGDVLTWTTSVVFGIFMLLAVALNLVANKQQADWDTLHGVKHEASLPNQPPAPPK